MSRVWWRRGVLVLWGLTLVLVALIHAIGQRWCFTAFFVYSPQIVWPAEMLALAVVVIWTSRKLALLMLATAGVLAGPVMGWRLHAAPAIGQGTDVLRVMTSNRGQHYGHTLASFIAQQKPDVLTIQDASWPQAFVPGAPEYQGFPHVGRLGQFVMLSRFPIVSTSLVVCRAQLSDQTPKTWFNGVRFVVQFHERQIAIYSVHTPSPRHALHAYNPAVPGKPDERHSNTHFWEEQEVLDEEMLKQIEADTLPVIVLGDWNVPALGPLYRRLTRTLTDSHTRAGNGYGFSFPGDVWYSVAWGGLWLRLDDVLCSKEWQPLACVVEPKTESQHSPVAAVLRWKGN